jgi:hypothetical protein
MAAPTTAPIRIDSNGTRQSPGVPSSVQSDGFQEKQNVPNTWWNSIFKNWSDWLRYLAGAPVVQDIRYQVAATDEIPVLDATETQAYAYTLPAGTIPATGLCRLLVKGTFHASAINGATTSIRHRLRIGPVTLTGDVFIDATYVPTGTQGICKFELELILESDGGVGSIGVGTSDVWMWTGTAGGWTHFPNDSGTSGAVPVRHMPATYDIDTTATNLIEVTTEWDDATTGAPSGRLANFSVDFAVLP